MNTEDITIFLGSKNFTLRDLLQQDPGAFLPYERSVIELCKKWTMGDEQFEVTTSGSTGSPKTIAFKRGQLKTSALLTAEALSLTSGMNALLCLDPSYIAGKMMVIRCLVIGMDLVVVNPVANPLDHIPEEIPRIAFTAMVPLQVATALDSTRASEINRLGTVIIGGGPVDSALRSRLQDLNTSFYATFGMTETISHVALQKLNGKDQTDYMQALRGVHFTTDERGCLVIESPFSERPLVTNDVVELIDAEKIKWLGRFDNMINTGGIKVIPEVVEPIIEAILKDQGIENHFFICGVHHPSLGQEIVLVIEGTVESDERVLKDLKDKLPQYTAPRRLLHTDNFLFTPTGKVRRRETLEQASPRPGV